MSNLEKINVLTKEKLDSLDLTQYKNQLFGTTDDTEDKAIAFAESERQKSKNLLSFIGKQKLSQDGGASVTISNSTMTISGTSIESTLRFTLNEPVLLKKDKTYVFSVGVKSGTATLNQCAVGLRDSNDNVIMGGFDLTVGNNQALITPSEDVYAYTFLVWLASGNIFNDYVVNMQLEEGSEATTYQPYNGTITHNGDAPVVFAESERQKSKNLLETNNFSGTLRWQEYLRVPLSAGTYTISGFVTSSDTDATNCLVNFMNTLGEPILGITLNRDNQTSKTFTLTEECILINFYASNDYNNSSGDTFKYKNMQIEKGEVATDYQPYGGGELTRDKDLYDVASKRELVYQHQGDGVVDITNSTLDTLQQYCSLFDLNPYKTYKAFKEPSTNPKIFEILGTPPRYSYYAYFRIKMYCEGVINSGKMYHPYRVYKVFAMSTSGALGEKYIVSDQSNTYVQGQWNELV